MFRINYILIISWFFLAACNRTEIMSDSVYGDPGDGIDSIPVEAVLAEPANYTDRIMAVAGTVHEVCQVNGCWLMLRSLETGDGLRVHTEIEESGEYVYTVPTDISGRHAVVFGTLSVTEEDMEAHFQEDAPGKDPALTMIASGVRVSPEETR